MVTTGMKGLSQIILLFFFILFFLKKINPVISLPIIMPIPMNKRRAGRPNRVETRVASTPATRSKPNNKIKLSVLKIEPFKHITSLSFVAFLKLLLSSLYHEIVMI